MQEPHPIASVDALTQQRRRMLYVSSSSDSDIPLSEHEHMEPVTTSRLSPPNQDSTILTAPHEGPNVKQILYQALKELEILKSCSSFANSSGNVSQNGSVEQTEDANKEASGLNIAPSQKESRR